MADPDARWHPPLRHVKAADVTDETAQTAGMRRFAAISGKSVGSEKLWMGRTHVAAATASGNHHHGESETAIFVVSGTPEFVFFDGDAEVRLRPEPGDFIFVPPFTPHREENNSPDAEAVVVIARSTQDAIVVNLPALRPAAELRRLGTARDGPPAWGGRRAWRIGVGPT